MLKCSAQQACRARYIHNTSSAEATADNPEKMENAPAGRNGDDVKQAQRVHCERLLQANRTMVSWTNSSTLTRSDLICG